MQASINSWRWFSLAIRILLGMKPKQRGATDTFGLSWPDKEHKA